MSTNTTPPSSVTPDTRASDIYLQELMAAAYEWWSIDRPETYSLLAHIENPSVNKQPQDARLCAAIAAAVKISGVPSAIKAAQPSIVFA